MHIFPLRSKTGTTVVSAYRSIFKDLKYSNPLRRRPIWLRRDKGNEFLNRSFQDMLNKEGIQFQTFTDPKVKCAIVEKFTALGYKLYFTYENTYMYIDVLPNFVEAYNNTVHNATGIAP